MNTISRTISGVGLFALGGFILYNVVQETASLWPTLWGAGWGVLLCGLGVYVFFNTKEDEIEHIKDSNETEN